MERVENIKKEKFQTTCSDGVVLKGILYIPQQPKAVVQFNCGTATKKEFYSSFLLYLAKHGFVCANWDYRGSGESAPADLAKCEYTYRDYGIKDMPAIKDYLNKRYPQLSLLIFGHSTGGQQLGFMHDLSGIKGVVNFAVSTGYLPNMPIRYRLLSYYFFYLFTPLSILIKNYLLAKPFGYMENLPRNVVTEWRDWCEKSSYFFDPKFYGQTVPEIDFNQFTFPIHNFYTVDDTISNSKNVQAFWQNFKSDRISFTQLDPKAFNLKEIGHFGFFKKKHKEYFWPMALDKLNEFLGN